MKIGTNTQLKNIHDMRNNVAENSFQRALSMAETHIKVKDQDAFKKSFVGYILDAVKSDSVLRHIDIQTLYNLNDISFHETRYKEYYTDYSLYNYDYIVTNDTQKDAYKWAVKVCELLNKSPQRLGIGRFERMPFINIDSELLHDTYSVNCEDILMLK